MNRTKVEALIHNSDILGFFVFFFFFFFFFFFLSSSDS
jgi:hypothetical protein